MTVEDLITKAPYEQQGAYSVGNRRRHLIGIQTQTASPLNEFVDNANRMIDADDATEARRPSPLSVINVFVAAEEDNLPKDTHDIESSKDPGAPAAGILLTATSELSTWLKLNQQQVANLVGISSSTIMAWKRSPSTHPRHSSIPKLLRLWAAVAGARDELGDTATLQVVWGSREHSGRVANSMDAAELTERLLAAAEEASLSAFEGTGDYDPVNAARISTGQLAADEESLSRNLNEYLADSGEPTAE